MSFYEEIILKILENGPLPRASLIKLLCPKIMSQKKLQKTLNKLEDENKIVCIPRRSGKNKKWLSWYALQKHKHLLSFEERIVVETIKELRNMLLRFPTIDEIACKLGITPEDAIKLAYKYAPETGWHPPSPEEISNSAKKLKEILKIAAYLKHNPNSQYVKSKNPEMVKYAKLFLIKYPKLIPKVENFFQTYRFKQKK